MPRLKKKYKTRNKKQFNNLSSKRSSRRYSRKNKKVYGTTSKHRRFKRFKKQGKYRQGRKKSRKLYGGSGSGAQEVAPTWTNVVEGGGCTLVRDGGVLVKKGGESDWDTGAFSNEVINHKEDSETQGLKWRTARCDKWYEMGLSHKDGGVKGSDNSKKDFAICCVLNANLFIRENGSLIKAPDGRHNFGNYNANDNFEIRVIGKIVTYHKNGALLHTSVNEPTFPLMADCSFYSPGARVENVVFGPAPTS